MSRKLDALIESFQDFRARLGPSAEFAACKHHLVPSTHCRACIDLEVRVEISRLRWLQQGRT